MKSNGHSQKSPISWDRARARLATADQIIREATTPSPHRARALLEARARQLAEPLAAGPRPGEVLHVAIFSLAREHYAIETRVLREIVRFSDFTPVPGAAEFLVGVTNLRGEILPVVALRRFFGLPDRGLSDQSRVLVLGHDRRELGVLADATDEVIDLRADAIHPPRSTAPSGGRAYIRGFTDQAVVVLDGDKLLEDPRLFIDHSEASRRSGRPE